jgi:hypothetical protein
MKRGSYDAPLYFHCILRAGTNIILTERRRDDIRWAFIGIATLTVITFLSILIVAATLTTQVGVPTISDFMDEFMGINIAVFVFLAMHMFFRGYMVVLFTSSTHVYNENEPAELAEFQEIHRYTETLIKWISRIHLLVFVVEATFLLMIPVVRVSDHMTLHFIVASVAFPFALLGEFLLWCRRLIIMQAFKRRLEYHTPTEIQVVERLLKKGNEDDGSVSIGDDEEEVNEDPCYMDRYQVADLHFRKYFGFSIWMSNMLLLLNMTLILSALACAITFMVISMQWFVPQVYTTMAFSEYFLVLLIVVLSVFHILDVYLTVQPFEASKKSS